MDLIFVDLLDMGGHPAGFLCDLNGLKNSGDPDKLKLAHAIEVTMAWDKSPEGRLPDDVGVMPRDIDYFKFPEHITTPVSNVNIVGFCTLYDED